MFPGPRQREHAPAPGSSPKLQVLNTAPMTAQTGLTLKEAWRDRDRAVDFVTRGWADADRYRGQERARARRAAWSGRREPVAEVTRLPSRPRGGAAAWSGY